MLNCPTCGVALRPTARICIKCGHALTDEERSSGGSQSNQSDLQPLNSSINQVVENPTASDCAEAPIFNEPVVDLPTQATPVIQSPPEFLASASATKNVGVNQSATNNEKVKYVLAGVVIVGAILIFINIFPKKEVQEIPVSSPAQVSEPEQQNKETETVVQVDPISLINTSNIRQVVATNESAQLLTNMLLSCTNAVRLIEMKSQIESLNIKPEKGDVKAGRLLNDRGLTSFKQENYLEAAQFFYQAYKANPADIEAMNNTAYALLKAGRYNEAEKWLGQVLTISPGRTSAWANLADVYANTGRMDSSVAAFVVGFQFAQNREKALQFLRDTAASDPNDNLRTAIQKALTILGQS